MATDYTNDGIVDAPVVVSAVSALLNRSQSNLSEVVNDTKSWTPEQVCTHSNVNAWAKYKPVPYYGVKKVDIFYANGKWDKGEGSDGWWMGGGNAVMTAPSLYGGDLINAISSSKVWSRVVPKGGMSEPYRLSDFIGYKHTARCPLRVFMPAVIYVNKTNTAGVTGVSYDDYEYTPSDVYNILKGKAGADIMVCVLIRYRYDYEGQTIEGVIDYTAGALDELPSIDITFDGEHKDDFNNYLYNMNINGVEFAEVLYNIGKTTELNVNIYLRRDIDVAAYYSAKFDSDSVVHKVYALTHESKYIDATFRYKVVPYADVEYGTWYINHQGTIFEISGYIAGFSQGELALKASENFDYESLYVRLYQQLSVDDEKNEEIYPYATLISKDEGYAGNTLNLELPNSIDEMITLYDSAEDAIYDRNGYDVYGYPIISARRLNDGTWEGYGAEFEIGGVSTAEDRFTSVRFNRLSTDI